MPKAARSTISVVNTARGVARTGAGGQAVIPRGQHQKVNSLASRYLGWWCFPPMTHRASPLFAKAGRGINTVS
jgi:hypothetical protein